jgi:hypothetical protein
MEYSTKIDHDDVPVSHGNTSIDQKGKGRGPQVMNLVPQVFVLWQAY